LGSTSLNDDVEYLFLDQELPFQPQWKLPQNLRNDLLDDSLTWIVYINPPFGTAQVGGAKGENKKGISDTKISYQMNKIGIGHVRRELFAQFIFRIYKELPDKTILGMFSKLKYLNAPDSIDYRDKYFPYKYEKGFVFKSTNFQGVKGQYPISFLIWNLAEVREKNQNNIEIDISDDAAVNVGIKNLALIKKGEVLNNWFSRPTNSNEYILPPLSNGITVKEGNLDKRHRARKDFLASICSNGNDFQHAKYVVILSSPNVSAGAFTVTPNIFEKSMVLHAVKKIPAPNWLNDRNQFLTPKGVLASAFVDDCVIWSLFANSNETTSLKDVVYEGNTYQIKNNFFPFLIDMLKQWEIRDPDIILGLAHDEDRFVAKWLKNKALSLEASAVLTKGNELYQYFYSNLQNLSTSPYRIQTWDVGWYQIRRCLTEQSRGLELISDLKILHNKLGEKILPDIEHCGFLDIDEVFEGS